MSKLIIIGAGGHGSELYSYLLDLKNKNQDIEFIGFVDENKTKGNDLRAKYLGDFDGLKAFLKQNQNESYYYITATGDNKLRMKFVEKIDSLQLKNIKPWILLHPLSIIGKDVEVGEGTCFAPGSIATTRIKIGKHCIINVNSSLSHDAVIRDFVNINPGVVVCGNVQIGKGGYIGAGAIIIDKITIGDWVTVGAGAVVVNDLPSNVKVVGVPAKILEKVES